MSGAPTIGAAAMAQLRAVDERYRRCLLAAMDHHDSTPRNPADAIIGQFAVRASAPIPPSTEQEFRNAGATADAANWPLSGLQFLWLCLSNGADPITAPRAWWLAPNEAMRDFYQQQISRAWEERPRP